MTEELATFVSNMMEEKDIEIEAPLLGKDGLEEEPKDDEGGPVMVRLETKNEAEEDDTSSCSRPFWVKRSVILILLADGVIWIRTSAITNRYASELAKLTGCYVVCNSDNIYIFQGRAKAFTPEGVQITALGIDYNIGHRTQLGDPHTIFTTQMNLPKEVVAAMKEIENPHAIHATQEIILPKEP